MNKIKFTRIKLDVNGNSRVVCSWLNFGTSTYAEAVRLSHQIGGKRYHCKSYGGGIVFQSTNTDDLEKWINNLRTTQGK